MTASQMVYAPPSHVTRRGRIDYRTTQPGFPGGRWGFEDFRVTRHGDGTRVLRACCELQDEPLLIRDLIQVVDRDYHPVEAYARLTCDDRFQGSAWYTFTDHEARVRGHGLARGDFAEERPISRAMRGFGTHALVADGWLTARFDVSRGPSVQVFRDNLMTSTDHRGATGPGFVTTTTSGLQYFGRETVAVRAGRFDCHHFAFVNTSHAHPPYDLWVTTDGDFLYVKGVVTAPYFWEFELVELA